MLSPSQVSTITKTSTRVHKRTRKRVVYGEEVVEEEAMGTYRSEQTMIQAAADAQLVTAAEEEEEEEEEGGFDYEVV